MMVFPKLLMPLLAVLMSSASATTELSPADIAARVRPSLVTITAFAEGVEIGTGSGFFIASDGTLVTNQHVVEGADRLEVELASGEIYDNVYYITSDARRDLVILRIPAGTVDAASVGDDRKAAVGDRIYVMGNPMGLGGTFSDGLISARRTIGGVSYLQITAPLSPGSSGGPVLNSSGEVIGVASITFPEGQNLNMAIPARYATGLLSIDQPARPFEDVAADLKPSDPPPTSATSASEEIPPWQQVLFQELAAVSTVAKEAGWTPVGEPIVALVNAGATHQENIHLGPSGRVFNVIAVCDSDCSDVDLALFELSGKELATDVETDDRPILRIEVYQEGLFTVHISMVACSVDPCGTVVQAFVEP